ncbi:hypothetical protein Esi_0019_0180 [Ectocarpus siliculosus]|uniref:Uncharacterized protein n=1 Tax=Ectocarpus siliculosus TaxID=2880 RepID=D8LHC3_ECTSI|nr:hypothetical protein Esi_0019_0180 [Ectocarpus siliculosus]|eukprot:CBN74342.1 hypothetical protein Esi_0019_0180 [Ectocarpus siliculosus]
MSQPGAGTRGDVKKEGGDSWFYGGGGGGELESDADETKASSLRDCDLS